MFRGFNVSIQNWDKTSLVQGRAAFEQRRMAVHDEISAYLTRGGTLDGKKMQEEWFPEVKADIFLSHAHGDHEDAIALAGWLKTTFGLDTFVDACVWGNSSDLLRLIDDKHCYNKTSNTYDYVRRNVSTSHVHMMLSVALTQMIDRCECVFFLNTPKSINVNSAISGSSTFSPWLFHEIAMTRLVRIRNPGRNLLQKGVVKRLDDSLQINHSVPIDHLTPLMAADLDHWKHTYTTRLRRQYPLDVLYELKPALGDRG